MIVVAQYLRNTSFQYPTGRKSSLKCSFNSCADRGFSGNSLQIECGLALLASSICKSGAKQLERSKILKQSRTADNGIRIPFAARITMAIILKNSAFARNTKQIHTATLRSQSLCVRVLNHSQTLFAQILTLAELSTSFYEYRNYLIFVLIAFWA
jgi:hypothetical protein